MTKLSYVRLVTSFLKIVGVYGGVSGVITILGDPGGETCTCRYPTGFADLKRLTALILEREREPWIL